MTPSDHWKETRMIRRIVALALSIAASLGYAAHADDPANDVIMFLDSTQQKVASGGAVSPNEPSTENTYLDCDVATTLHDTATNRQKNLSSIHILFRLNLGEMEYEQKGRNVSGISKVDGDDVYLWSGDKVNGYGLINRSTGVFEAARQSNGTIEVLNAGACKVITAKEFGSRLF
jgi:hypothetical protein